MTIKTFACNMLQENCYVVSDESGACAIIDCGAYYEEERAALVDYIEEAGLTPVHLLSTHGHLDHNFGNNTVLERWGLLPEISANDAPMLDQAGREAEAFYGMTLSYELPHAGHLLENGEEIVFGSVKLRVIETPGHSKGSVVFYCEEEGVCFTGDTLFRMSIGRTDLKGGSMMQIIQSLRMLAQLPDSTRVLPGHGPETTIGEELRSNPWMDR